MDFLSDIAITENGADFRLLDKKVVKVLRDCREEYLFLRGMVSWVGFRRIQIPYQAGIRYAGTTKYSFKKMVLFAVCGITSFQHPSVTLGCSFCCFFRITFRCGNYLCIICCFYFGAGCDRLGVSGYTDFCVGGSNLINARYYRRVFG